MGALTWDEVGTREYEVGVSKCVLFVKDNNGDYGNGVAWSGITAITETPEGAEANDIYADNIKYGSIRSNETFGGTIEAYTYPDEWGECDGLSSPSEGVEVGGQTRKQFGLSYRTEIGSDTNQEAGYKLHLVWGATASPSERGYETINDSPDAITFSWEFDTSPVVTPGYKPISHMAIDSTAVDDDGRLALQALEIILYGNDGIDSMFPTPEEVIAMFGGSGIVHTIITNASNAEAWAVGTRGGQPVEESDPTYHNSSKYHSEQSATYYQDAGYDVDFDSDEEKIYLLNQNGERTGDGAALDLSSYAKIDGYYENLGAGTADQLASTVKTIDQEPYGFRTSGGSADIGNRSDNEAIVGVSLPWKQLWPQPNFESTTGVTTTDSATISVSNNVLTITGPSPNHLFNLVAATEYRIQPSRLINHVIMFYADIKSNVPISFKPTSYMADGSKSFGVLSDTTRIWYVWKPTSIIENHVLNMAVAFNPVTDVIGVAEVSHYCVFDFTTMFGTEIADYIYSLEQSNEGDGYNWFTHYFPNDYYAYNAGNGLLHVQGLQSHDMTGFNLFNKDDTSNWHGLYFDSQGVIVSSGTARAAVLSCFPNTTYYSIKSIGHRHALGSFVNYPQVGDKSTNTYVGTLTPGTGIRYTTGPNDRYLVVWFYSDTGDPDLTPAEVVETLCINLSWSGYRNGEYEQYKKHSYPLDSSVVLRGIPKKDANGKLVYDGDRYLPNGMVDRRYGIVDLGTLTWINTNTSVVGKSRMRSSAVLTNVKLVATNSDKANIICGKYITIKDVETAGTSPNPLTIGIAIDTIGYVRIYDPAYDDGAAGTPAAFKTAMSGVYLVYELATPTTEEADPYQLTQIVDDFGTEEYVMTDQNGVKIPVGHITAYPQNLRDKVQHQPDLAESDGTYAIKQVGRQLSLVPMLTPTELPPAPTENDTYSLKVTVNDGTATYFWANT